jgi:hypothetical protein
MHLAQTDMHTDTDMQTNIQTHKTCWHTTPFFLFRQVVSRPPPSRTHTHSYTRHTCRHIQHGERSVAGGRGRHLQFDNDTCCVQSAIGKEHSVHAFCVWSCTIMNCLIVKVNVCVCVKMHDSFTWCPICGYIYIYIYIPSANQTPRNHKS